MQLAKECKDKGSLDCLTLSLIGLDVVYHIHYTTQMESLNFLQLVLFLFCNACFDVAGLNF